VKHTIDIIIPTYNNRSFLQPCLTSFLTNTFGITECHIWVVNNGHKNSCDFIEDNPRITVLQTGGKNLGWEGGLDFALKECKAPFVMFLNDDTYFPSSSRMWLDHLLQGFSYPKTGAVGPLTNNAMGLQNMLTITNWHIVNVPYLIGFCMLLKRSVLDEVGGVDLSLPGGDDLDLSIRLKDAGYNLLINRNAFVYHYGFQTGTRLFGDHTVNGGWNSYEQYSRTNTALIKKHGLKRWWLLNKVTEESEKTPIVVDPGLEVKAIKKYIPSARGKKILEIGCGGTKTFPETIGIDIVAKGDTVHQLLADNASRADIAADVSKELPLEEKSYDGAIARHILEHMVNPISAVRHWLKPLKTGAKLVIVVPNEDNIKSIPMNPEHFHAFNPESMYTFLQAVGGWKTADIRPIDGWFSLIAVVEKI
jgi:GT2 family glycosyltransferase/SAM-dependent methyltransferase